MTVKAKRGRRRYIAVKLTPAPRSRGDAWHAMLAGFRRAGISPERIRLLILDGETAVVSCAHTAVTPVSAVLNGSLGPYTSRTLLVSGTVRTVKEKYGLL